MVLEAKIAIVIGLAIVAAIAGLIWRNRTGKSKSVRDGGIVNLKELAALKNGNLVSKFGRKTTFIQFSSEYCTQCTQTARLLSELEKADDGILHVEIDITNRLELAKKFNVLQTPTTLVLDSKGRIKSRIGGAPKVSVIQQELEEIQKESFEI
jgi:thiol-disulfide isomerase/thioredoxin